MTPSDYRDNSAASVRAFFKRWRPLVAVGQYSYSVVLGLSGSARDSARIAAVHLTSEVQVVKILLPNLVPGTVNHSTYQDRSPALDQHDVKVSVTVQ
jgi:hypothetical protein